VVAIIIICMYASLLIELQSAYSVISLVIRRIMPRFEIVCVVSNVNDLVSIRYYVLATFIIMFYMSLTIIFRVHICSSERTNNSEVIDE
jgi:hypothetical protein